jgi:hypothetical protein
MKETLIAILISIGAIGALFMALKQVSGNLRKEPTDILVLTEGEEPSMCPCGAPATHPVPTLARSREDGLVSKDRDMYAGAPRYQRQVVAEGPKKLCRVHAHLADAKMDEFIYVSIRAIQADCNSKIAREAAVFEKETLPQAIEDSLTEREKKEKRVKSLPKTNGATNGASAAPLLS